MRPWFRKVVIPLALTFLGLLINEIFFNPPLMAAHQLPDLRGTWTNGMMRIEIDAAGRVSGSIDGRVEPNRTWLGKKLNLRTDYRIVGVRPDLRPVSAPFNLKDGKIAGAMFVGPNYKASGPSHMVLTREPAAYPARL